MGGGRCLLVALVTGQTSPGWERSNSGCEGGRTVDRVPTTGQTSAAAMVDFLGRFGLS